MTNTTNTADKNALSKRMFALGWRLFRAGTHIECHGYNLVFSFCTITKEWIGTHPEEYVALEEAFKRFDWSFDYSDDFGVCKRGQVAKDAIEEACKKLLTEQQVNIMNRKYNGDEPGQFDIKCYK